MTLEEARSELLSAALPITHDTWNDVHLIKALCEAASAYAAARASSAPSRPAVASGAVFPPYGRSKGAPVAGASEGDLRFYHAGCLRTLEDPTKARWHAKEKELLAAIEAEMEA